MKHSPWIRQSTAHGAAGAQQLDRNTRGGKALPMEPDRARRYNNRTTAERFNSDLKDNHGGSMVRVRGNKKVHAHLMFGVLVIFAKGVIGLVT